MSLRTHLVFLVVVAVVPAAVAFTLLARESARREALGLERGLRDTTRALTLAVDRELERHIAALEALAASPHLDPGAPDGLRRFYEHAQRVVPTQAGWSTVTLVERSGRFLLGTLFPYGTELGTVAEQPQFLETRPDRATVSNLFLGKRVARWWLITTVPVRREQRHLYNLSALFTPESLQEVFREQRIPPDWVSGVVDRNGIRVVRTRDHERYVGQPARADFVAATRKASEGFFRDATGNVYTAFSRSSLSGWTIGIAVPVALVEGPSRQALMGFLGVALGIGGVSLLMAGLVARRIAGAVGSLAQTAGASPAPSGAGAPTTGIREVNTVGQALASATAQLQTNAQREHALRSDAERAREMLTRVQTIADTALGDLRLDALLGELLARVRVAVGADGAVILLRKLQQQEEEEERLHVRAALGFEDKIDHRVGIPVGQGFAGRVAQVRRPLVWEEETAAQDVSPWIHVEGLRSLAGVPLLMSGGLLGVLLVGSVTRQQFGTWEVQLLQLAAERMGLGIERAARRDAERREQEAAEAANRAKDEFLAMLGHELRNPLGAIVNAVNVLGEVGQPDDHAARLRAIIARQGQHLTRLVDDLLDVSRLAAGKMELRREPVNLKTTAEQCLATIPQVERLRERGLTLEAEPVWVEGDPARLEQVLTNLVDNALKYTPPAGRIAVTIRAEGPEAVVRVRDTGVGIAAELLPRIFDVFVQARQTPHRLEGGLGLGLTIVKRLTALHRGTVAVASDGPGRGTEFVVRLPILLQGSEALPAAVEPAKPPQGQRILLIEDHEDTRESLRLLLEAGGHRVEVAADGRTGLARLSALRPDLAFVDVGLPGLDGYAVARAVRASPRLRAVYLVALTGYGDPQHRREAAAAGFDAHVVKPVTPERLADILTRASRRPRVPDTGEGKRRWR